MNIFAKVLWVLVAIAALGYGVLYVTGHTDDNGLPTIVTLNEPDIVKNRKNDKRFKKFVRHDAPKPMPDLIFTGTDNLPIPLKSFRGKTILLNVWATWCAPCREEMPSLDRLQQALGSKDFEVVALSADRTGIAGATKFFADHGIKNLAVYADPTTRTMKPLQVLGMPTTLLIDAEGREIGRLTGPAEWDSADSIKLILKALEAQKPTP